VLNAQINLTLAKRIGSKHRDFNEQQARIASVLIVNELIT